MTEFLKAFVKVQKTLKPAIKDSVNPHFKSKFANLASCYEACRDVLSDNGFSVFQIPRIDGNLLILKTYLMHISGGELIGIMPICTIDTPPQAKGSALTYTRRQLLCSMVGIAPDDDDANAAQEGFQAKPQIAIVGPVKKKSAVSLAGDYLIPWGSEKGQPIKSQSVERIKKSLTWCQQNNKGPEYQEAMLAYLASLESPDELDQALQEGELPFDEFDK